MNLGMLVLLAIASVAVAGVTAFLIKLARGIAPAYVSDRYSSDFGGLLTLFLTVQVAWFLSSAIGMGYGIIDMIAAIGTQGASLMKLFMQHFPAIIAAALGSAILNMIVKERKPSALVSIVVLLWVIGPGAALLQAWYFGAELSDLSKLFFFGWPTVATAYLVLSPRVALIYGTKRGARIASGGDPGVQIHVKSIDEPQPRAASGKNAGKKKRSR